MVAHCVRCEHLLNIREASHDYITDLDRRRFSLLGVHDIHTAVAAPVWLAQDAPPGAYPSSFLTASINTSQTRRQQLDIRTVEHAGSSEPPPRELVGVLVAVNKFDRIGTALPDEVVPFEELDERLLVGVADQLGIALKMAAHQSVLQTEQEERVDCIASEATLLAGLRAINAVVHDGPGAVWTAVEAYSAHLVGAKRVRLYLAAEQTGQVLQKVSATPFKAVAKEVRLS